MITGGVGDQAGERALGARGQGDQALAVAVQRGERDVRLLSQGPVEVRPFQDDPED